MGAHLFIVEIIYLKELAPTLPWFEGRGATWAVNRRAGPLQWLVYQLCTWRAILGVRRHVKSDVVHGCGCLVLAWGCVAQSLEMPEVRMVPNDGCLQDPWLEERFWVWGQSFCGLKTVAEDRSLQESCIKPLTRLLVMTEGRFYYVFCFERLLRQACFCAGFSLFSLHASNYNVDTSLWRYLKVFGNSLS